MQQAKRWRMLAKQQVVLEEFDYDPTALGPREVAVRVDFTAISPGTECANYLALDPNVHIPGSWCAYPWVPGYAGCGHVLDVGAAVTEYKPGDPVVGLIRHLSHATVNADTDIVSLDARLTPEHATYLRLISIAYTPLQVIQHDHLPVVGVWGLGMIGNLVAQLLQRSGGRVVGIDPVPERRVTGREMWHPGNTRPIRAEVARARQ